MDINRIVENPVEFVKETPKHTIIKTLKAMDDAYFNTNSPLVPDHVYDIIKSRSGVKTGIGAPEKLNKTRLPFSMASLDKIKDQMALETFTRKYKGPYIVSDKLDGVSGLLHKDRLFTRGDGTYGRDISHFIPGLSLNTSNMTIRGEFITSKKHFSTIKGMANARNMVSGVINSKDFEPRLKQSGMTFVAYNIISPRMTQIDQLTELANNGFRVVKYKIFKTLNFNELVEYLIERREKGRYFIDGIVITDTSKVYNNTKDNPKHSLAFKQVYEDQKAKAKVKGVVWSESRYGYLKPTILIYPVSLVGVTISKTSGFNAKYIKDNCIGKGSSIEIIRSGDVIPHITNVLTKSKTGSPDMPSNEYEWVSDYDIASKQASSVLLAKEIHFFFSTLGVNYAGLRTIESLIANGFDSIEKIITAKETDYHGIHGLGKKSFARLKEEMTKSLESVKMETLMAASGCFGRGIGEKKLLLIINNYPDILNIEINMNHIKQIDGFAEKTAKQFVDNLSKFKSFYARIAEYVTLSENISNKLLGKQFVFTGFRDKNLENKIRQNGGIIGNSLTRQTHTLIYKDKKGHKVEKAIEYKTNLVSLSNIDKIFT